MTEITVGQVVVIQHDDGVTFQDRGNPCRSVRVSDAHLLDLMSFMSALTPDEPDRRTADRFPLWHSCGLTASITLHQRTWAVTALNLSTAGIVIHAETTMPEIWLGTELSLTLNLGQDTMSIRGIVRRRNGREYGIQFPSSLADASFEPPETLLNIIGNIERASLVRKIKAGWSTTLHATPQIEIPSVHSSMTTGRFQGHHNHVDTHRDGYTSVRDDSVL